MATQTVTSAQAEKALANVVLIIEPLIADLTSGNFFALIGSLSKLPSLLADIAVIKAYIAGGL